MNLGNNEILSRFRLVKDLNTNYVIGIQIKYSNDNQLFPNEYTVEHWRGNWIVEGIFTDEIGFDGPVKGFYFTVEESNIEKVKDFGFRVDDPCKANDDSFPL